MTSSVCVSRRAGPRLVDGVVTYSSHLAEMAAVGRRNSDAVRQVELRLRVMMLVILLMTVKPGFRAGSLYRVVATRCRVLAARDLGRWILGQVRLAIELTLVVVAVVLPDRRLQGVIVQRRTRRHGRGNS